MAPWILILVALSTLALLYLKLLLIPKHHPLPPGPLAVAFFVKHVLLRKKSMFELEAIIHELHSVYGPVVALRALSAPTVFIQGRDATHQALVQLGTVFANRPPHKEPMVYLSCNGHDINSSSYGPLWRLLRRNLSSEMLHPSRVRQFGGARRWAVQLLLDNIRNGAQDNDSGLVLKPEFKLAIFSLIAAMCFGEMIGKEQIGDIQDIQRSLIQVYARFNVFAILPSITKVLFRKRWEEIAGTRQRQAEIFIPLISARREQKHGTSLPYCYVDSVLDIRIPEEQGDREFTEVEMVNLCHEFMIGGTDTSITALEWIMAEVVKRQDVQNKLVQEIDDAVPADEEITEEDLDRMPYLKAVIMEGLRRHPPAHFLLPHRAEEDAELNGYRIPKGADLYITTAQIGWDGELWEEPMEFRPERFLKHNGGEYDGDKVDITGSKEIKMMPFGAGRRMCPGYGLAMLHLEWFVANLVREFEWTETEGEEVDLTVDFEFTFVMKKPLRARILPRRNR